jgi:hypothetical protein
MSTHILSKVEAGTMWHLRSTCQVIGLYPEQMVLLREVPVVGTLVEPKSPSATLS